MIGASACVLLFWLLGVYSSTPSPLNVCETERLLRGMSAVALATSLSVSYLNLRMELAVFMLSFCAVLLLIAQRGFVRMLVPARQSRPRALIYALRRDGDLFTIVRNVSGNTIEFVGVIQESAGEYIDELDIPWPSVGIWDDLHRIARETRASHVLVVGCDVDGLDTQRIFRKCEQLRLHCSVLLDPRSLPSVRPAFTLVDELPVMHQPSTGIRTHFLHLKRAVDVVIGSCLLVAALPIGVLVAAGIKYDSRGPVFFRQQRVGKDGQPFDLLKFRTMHTSSPKYSRSPTSAFDPRITQFGRLLRRLSLDELPQLLNVLKGDMSLVGPRPEMPFIVRQYSDAAWARLAVRPGMTGLWQISRARTLPIHQNLQYDLFYIERQSIFLDAAILLRTFGAVVRGIGAA